MQFVFKKNHREGFGAMADNMIRTYNGAVAVVTGAASGIGRGLAQELAKRGSEVILADLQIELAEELSAEQLLKMLERFRPMAPGQFARKALNAVARNEAIIIVPSWWKLFWWLNRLSPALLMLFIQKQYNRRDNSAAPGGRTLRRETRQGSPPPFE